MYCIYPHSSITELCGQQHSIISLLLWYELRKRIDSFQSYLSCVSRTSSRNYQSFLVQFIVAFQQVTRLIHFNIILIKYHFVLPSTVAGYIGHWARTLSYVQECFLSPTLPKAHKESQAQLGISTFYFVCRVYVHLLIIVFVFFKVDN